MVDLSKATLTIPLGTVCGNGGFLEFWMDVQADGNGQLWASMHSGGSKFSAILTKLDESGLDDLKKIVDGIVSVVAELKPSKRMERLEL